MPVALFFAWILLAMAAPLPESVRFVGVARQGDREVALLEFGSGPGCRLMQGEECRGLRLVGLEGGVLTLIGEEGTFALELSAGHSSGKEAMSRSPERLSAVRREPEAPADSVTERPSASADTAERRLFSRDEVRLRLPGELPRILSASTLIPRIIGSEVAGLELVSFPEDTILGETGLLPGDVLLSVGGREVRGVESLAVLVQRFQTADRLDLLVDRNEQILTLTLEFQ